MSNINLHQDLCKFHKYYGTLGKDLYPHNIHDCKHNQNHYKMNEDRKSYIDQIFCKILHHKYIFHLRKFSFLYKLYIFFQSNFHQVYHIRKQTFFCSMLNFQDIVGLVYKLHFNYRNFKYKCTHY